jgi:hypothetical protein
MPVVSKSFLERHGDDIKRNLTNTMYALGGPGAGRAAVGAGKLVGGLADSAVKGFRAGKSEMSSVEAIRRARNAADAAESAKESAKSAAATKARRARAADKRVEESTWEGEGGRAFARGGRVSGRGDGIAQRGRTKGTFR